MNMTRREYKRIENERQLLHGFLTWYDGYECSVLPEGTSELLDIYMDKKTTIEGKGVL